MTPTPDRDVVVDLTAVAEDTTGSMGAPATVRADYSWNLDGDVLRDLLLRAG